MTVAEDALAALRRALDARRWAPGERLPPERDLASSLGVGRTSLRKALAELEREGRIWRRVGQGTFVSRASGDAACPSVRLAASPSPADVMELRMIVEPAIAAAVALRAAEPEIAALREMAAGAARPMDWIGWEDHDSRFHAALAAAGRNPLLVEVLASLTAIRRQNAWGRLRSSTLNPERQRAFADQHRQLVEAIARRDAPAAAAAMRAHLAAVRRDMIGGRADPAVIAVAGDPIATGAADAR